MSSVLFVEDNLELIGELAELLQAEMPDLQTDFAVDIPTTLAKLTGQVYNTVILDVMLPAYPNVPSQDEGIYLAAWILGKFDKLTSKPRPDWLKDTRPVVIFLTSRTKTPIEEKWRQLADCRCPPVIERLRGDAYDHCRDIQKHME